METDVKIGSIWLKRPDSFGFNMVKVFDVEARSGNRISIHFKVLDDRNSVSWPAGTVVQWAYRDFVNNHIPIIDAAKIYREIVESF